jgi:hypothetical protein
VDIDKMFDEGEDSDATEYITASEDIPEQQNDQQPSAQPNISSQRSKFSKLNQLPAQPSTANSSPKFEQIQKLPGELRNRIYELALFTGQPIRPHLCNPPSFSCQRDAHVKFHDDFFHGRMNPDHTATSKLLGITRVSKAIRAEPFPCFYSSNTFAITPDTPTYFAHLENMGKFHMTQFVRFIIPLMREQWAAQYLAQMNTYILRASAYKKERVQGVAFTSIAKAVGLRVGYTRRDIHAGMRIAI